MKVGDLVCMTEKFCDSPWMQSKDRTQKSGIIVKKYTAWVDPFMVENEEPSMDGFQYDVVFGSELIQGLLWGWEITEVRQNECR